MSPASINEHSKSPATASRTASGSGAVAGEVFYGKPGERIVRYFETEIAVR